MILPRSAGKVRTTVSRWMANHLMGVSASSRIRPPKLTNRSVHLKWLICGSCSKQSKLACRKKCFFSWKQQREQYRVLSAAVARLEIVSHKWKMFFFSCRIIVKCLKHLPCHCFFFCVFKEFVKTPLKRLVVTMNLRDLLIKWMNGMWVIFLQFYCLTNKDKNIIFS